MDTHIRTKEDRYIAIVGETWAEMLGQHAEWLTPKVGIVLHGGDDSLRESLSNMQIISGNVGMAMRPLQEIMKVMLHNTKEYVRLNKVYKKAAISMELALEHVKQAEAALRKEIL